MTLTPAGAVQEGGGECHPLGHPCRAGGIAADCRRCVIIFEDRFIQFTEPCFNNTNSIITTDGVSSPDRVASAKNSA